MMGLLLSAYTIGRKELSPLWRSSHRQTGVLLPGVQFLGMVMRNRQAEIKPLIPLR